MPIPEVKPGTVWADNYPGNEGRTVRVDSVEAQYAYCTTVTNSATSQRELDRGSSWARDMRGKPTRILLRSFHAGPARSGYSLATEISDADS